MREDSQELGLDTLDERMKREDLITAYKVLTGKDNVDPSIWFTPFDYTGHLNVPKQDIVSELWVRMYQIEINKLKFGAIKVGWRVYPSEGILKQLGLT